MIKKLKESRLECEYTQKEMAAFLNITQQTYSDYETGRTNPDIDTLTKIADVLNVAIDYLLGRADDFGNITIYKNTENVDTLSPDEQRIIERIRKNPPHNATEWIELYAELPDYMQENIFAELKGMYLGYKATKEKQTKEQA